MYNIHTVSIISMLLYKPEIDIIIKRLRGNIVKEDI